MGTACRTAGLPSRMEQRSDLPPAAEWIGLATRARAGDRHALGRLLSRHGAWLRRIARIELHPCGRALPCCSPAAPDSASPSGATFGVQGCANRTTNSSAFEVARLPPGMPACSPAARTRRRSPAATAWSVWEGRRRGSLQRRSQPSRARWSIRWTSHKLPSTTAGDRSCRARRGTSRTGTGTRSASPPVTTCPTRSRSPWSSSRVEQAAVDRIAGARHQARSLPWQRIQAPEADHQPDVSRTQGGVSRPS